MPGGGPSSSRYWCGGSERASLHVGLKGLKIWYYRPLGGVVFLITRRVQFGPTTFLWEVQAPDVARAARAGHFVMARIDEHGERIPLTVADFDAGRGTVTVVIQAVGKTTLEMMGLARRRPTAGLHRAAGAAEPHPQAGRHRGDGGRRAGRGAGLSRSFAPISSRATARFRSSGSATGTWCSGKTHSASYSDELIVTTDDGSYGRQGFVTARAGGRAEPRKGRAGSGGDRADSDDEGLLRK